MAIQHQTGNGKPTIWRWQARFMAEGVDGLLHGATRPCRKKPLTAATIELLVAMTLAEPPRSGIVALAQLADQPGDSIGRVVDFA